MTIETDKGLPPSSLPPAYDYGSGGGTDLAPVEAALATLTSQNLAESNETQAALATLNATTIANSDDQEALMTSMLSQLTLLNTKQGLIAENATFNANHSISDLNVTVLIQNNGTLPITVDNTIVLPGGTYYEVAPDSYRLPAYLVNIGPGDPSPSYTVRVMHTAGVGGT